MFNKKKLKELENRIEKLESQSKFSIDPFSYTSYNGYWSMNLKQVSLKEIVKDILSYLKLEIVYKNAENKPEQFLLQSIKKEIKK